MSSGEGGFHGGFGGAHAAPQLEILWRRREGKERRLSYSTWAFLHAFCYFSLSLLPFIPPFPWPQANLLHPSNLKQTDKLGCPFQGLRNHVVSHTRKPAEYAVRMKDLLSLWLQYGIKDEARIVENDVDD